MQIKKFTKKSFILITFLIISTIFAKFFRNQLVKFILNIVFFIVNPTDIQVFESIDLANSKNVHLIDTRSDEEYLISHISNAKLLNYDSSDVLLNKFISKNNFVKSDTLVFYCSVGYRSGKIAERFKNQGFNHVYNLKGGIFRWINSDYLLYDNNKNKTDSIHTYNEFWKVLVVNGFKIN